MSTAPYISLFNNSEMNSLRTDQSWYLIYADDVEFSSWTDWVNDPSSSPDANEIANASNFSNYVLKMKC